MAIKEIPVGSVELERVYAQIINSGYRSVAITSAEQGEGVTTLSLALAKLSATRGQRTLLVDFNLAHPEIGAEFGIEFKPEESLTQTIWKNLQPTDIPNLFVLPAPINTPLLLELRGKEKLTPCFSHWLEQFNFVIVDCSCVNSVDPKVIPAEVVCACSEASVLVVLAGETVEAKVQEAAHKLIAADSRLIGTVINDQFNPRLDDELIRESHRFDRYSFKWMEKFREFVRNSSLLSTDI